MPPVAAIMSRSNPMRVARGSSFAAPFLHRIVSVPDTGDANAYPLNIRAFAAGIDLHGVFDEQVAQRTVRMYRKLYDRIPACWRELDRIKQPVLLNDHTTQEAKLGPVTIMSRRIRLPNGLYLRYDDIPAEDLYGGKLLNHICQSLAYVILMRAARRLHRKGLRFVTQIHDELIFCVSDEHVGQARAIIKTEMERSPDWLRDLPLATEIGVGDNYGGVK